MVYLCMTLLQSHCAWCWDVDDAEGLDVDDHFSDHLEGQFEDDSPSHGTHDPVDTVIISSLLYTVEMKTLCTKFKGLFLHVDTLLKALC